jgi:hypothetical protein
MQNVRRRVLGISVCALGILFAGAQAAVSAPQADPVITSYESDVRVERDGVLKVTETWKLKDQTDTFTRHLVTREHEPDDVDHVLEVEDVQVKAGGADKKAEVSTDGDVTSVAVGGVAGASELEFTYTVRGAVAKTLNGTELRWTPLHGLPSEVQSATVTLSVPEVSHVQCSAGPLGANTPCTLAQIAETSAPQFKQFALPPGNSMRMTVGFPEGEIAANTIVEYRKSFKRSFKADGARLGGALAVLLLGAGGLLLLYRARGRDQLDSRRVVPASLFSLGSDTRIEFTPPSDLRPGEVGTLIDERIDPVDVTATVFDLAVRGHLTITELEHDNEFSRPDWELKRVDSAPAEELQRYENVLMRALFGESATVKVSELGQSVRRHLGEVQDALYDDVTGRGWFAERPDRIRSKWNVLGWIVVGAGVLLTFLLAYFSVWGLLGLAVVAIGAALVALGQHMPSKSPAAGKVLGQIASIRGELLEMDVSELPDDQHVELCGRALPYAVVLGGSDRWIDALVATDADEQPDDGFGWYRGPAGWHLQHLPDSLRNLNTNLTGSLFTR